MDTTALFTALGFRRTVRDWRANGAARLCLSIGLVVALTPGVGAAVMPVDSQAMVAAHNQVRAQFGQAPLGWSQEMEQVAANWASQLEANPEWCRAVIHSADRPDRTGESCYAATYNAQPAEIVTAWASEQQYYDLGSGSCQAGHECGHFVQVVWGETKELGCAAIVCQDIPQEGEQWFVTVCNYRPGLLYGQKPF